MDYDGSYELLYMNDAKKLGHERGRKTGSETGKTGYSFFVPDRKENMICLCHVRHELFHRWLAAKREGPSYEPKR